MKQKLMALCLALATALALLSGCSGSGDSQADSSAPDAAGSSAVGEASTEPDTTGVATSADMTTVEDVVEEDMEPVYSDSLADGSYSVTVDSSSSMFKITACTLTVAEGQMTAEMTMSGTGYLYLYMGTAEEAAGADESSYLSYTENDAGEHVFTVPVDALDEGISCAAFSKRKELWYDRTLVFRADSLPQEAFAEGVITTPESLDLADGTYTVEVTLEGGSGKASVQSPCTLTVESGACTAEIVWSSSNYDYMMVDGSKLEPTTLEPGSTFEVPVSGFDYKMAVQADTTAMSQPYLIDYTLSFDSATLQEQS